MENQNILTIKFNDTEDLALKIAEWNGILNHQCCGNCHDEKHPAEQVTKAMCETAPKAEPTTKQEKNRKLQKLRMTTFQYFLLTLIRRLKQNHNLSQSFKKRLNLFLNQNLNQNQNLHWM